MKEILAVDSLTVTLNGICVLSPVSFRVQRGETLAIIGPNGAGKSILVRALVGLEPYEGSIRWASSVRVGYVPQKIEADRHLPVNLKNLLSAKAAILGLSDADIQNAVTGSGIDTRTLLTPIGHLSGGRFQRSLIALALLGGPAVLILDEPTASIDRPGEEEFYDLLHQLQDERGMTVLLVSHDLSFVTKYATTVLCLNHTGTVCFGPPDTALTIDTIEKLYASRRFVHHIHEH